jgi:hypothetical protein
MLLDAGRLSQPGLAGQDDGSRPVGHLQLAENAGNVVAHRPGAQDKLFGDFAIAVALRYQVEDLALALGQVGEGLGG